MIRNNVNPLSILLFFFIIVLASSCCFQIKCKGFDNQYYFRLQNVAGQDLVFGPDKQYPLSSIVAFSRKDNQNLPHELFYQVMDNNDTVLSVNFSYDKYDTVFIRLGSSGLNMNTLINKTDNSSSNCCDEDQRIVPVSFNGVAVMSANNINVFIK